MKTKDIIKGLRKKYGYTTKQVAEGTDISENVYPKYESGILNAGVPVLCKIADFYGVTVDYLLGREKPIQPDILTQLAREFSLTDLEKALVQAYIAISPEERDKFIKSIEEVAKQKDTTEISTELSVTKLQQQILPPSDIPISKKAIARGNTEENLDIPTTEQITGFTLVPEDSDL
ncbi:MAG: helix-turn-helix transcriptional regulator [Ruminococcus sp.]|nr:helix-turn-helix transcriptional regulator [Ruminococcus sp.]MDE6679636.1 helix-turn-helix transcriptional regulator [Ruminococcus sp.]